MESEEWKQFQRDLQTAVVIANNFSQETEKEMEKLTVENVQLHERLVTVEMEMDKIRQENKVLKQAAEELSCRKHSIFTNAEFKGKVRFSDETRNINYGRIRYAHSLSKKTKKVNSHVLDEV